MIDRSAPTLLRRPTDRRSAASHSASATRSERSGPRPDGTAGRLARALWLVSVLLGGMLTRTDHFIGRFSSDRAA